MIMECKVVIELVTNYLYDVKLPSYKYSDVLFSIDLCISGVVSGLLGQMNDFAMLPAYLISLSFTFNSERGEGEVYWPGCAFGIVSAVY